MYRTVYHTKAALQELPKPIKFYSSVEELTTDIPGIAEGEIMSTLQMEPEIAAPTEVVADEVASEEPETETAQTEETPAPKKRTRKKAAVSEETQAAA